MAVRTVTIWSVNAGRLAEFLEIGAKAKVIQERLGAKCRLSSIAFGGATTGQMVYTMEHPSLAALAAFSEQINADPEWHKLWAAAMSANTNPTASIVSHSIVSDVPGF